MPDIGDGVHGMESADFEGYVDIRPPEGEEWFIPNIYFQQEVELIKTDGDNEIVIARATNPEGGSWAAYKYFVSRDYYLRVRNTSSQEESQVIGYEGVRSS
ncbi:hypothetical protein [Marinococcus luteus]|uniref:hypothetical protein n=1 Tax=Marinococcus luteus TaxID=1122204 RepID=UPI002ACD10B7|nr:hypothetical protein [Marinococcus luteus]MDZ5782115.1 hypothetical protein [Marinococcus luteus]